MPTAICNRHRFSIHENADSQVIYVRDTHQRGLVYPYFYDDEESWDGDLEDCYTRAECQRDIEHIVQRWRLEPARVGRYFFAPEEDYA